MISDEIEEYLCNIEPTVPSRIEEFCWLLFTMIIGFVFGFMVGVSY